MVDLVVSAAEGNVSIKFEVWQQLDIDYKVSLGCICGTQSYWLQVPGRLAVSFFFFFVASPLTNCTSSICWQYLWKIKLNCSLNKAKIKSKYCQQNGKAKATGGERHIYICKHDIKCGGLWGRLWRPRPCCLESCAPCWLAFLWLSPWPLCRNFNKRMSIFGQHKAKNTTRLRPSIRLYGPPTLRMESGQL